MLAALAYVLAQDQREDSILHVLQGIAWPPHFNFELVTASVSAPQLLPQLQAVCTLRRGHLPISHELGETKASARLPTAHG